MSERRAPWPVRPSGAQMLRSDAWLSRGPLRRRQVGTGQGRSGLGPRRRRLGRRCRRLGDRRPRPRRGRSGRRRARLRRCRRGWGGAIMRARDTHIPSLPVAGVALPMLEGGCPRARAGPMCPGGADRVLTSHGREAKRDRLGRRRGERRLCRAAAERRRVQGWSDRFGGVLALLAQNNGGWGDQQMTEKLRSSSATQD
jgi:hypothetical protein